MKETVGFEKLYESHLKAQRGVIWKDSVAWFSLHAVEQTVKLSNELNAGTYQPKPLVAFTIAKPKKRDILANAYRDRVYQRSVNDNKLYPAMTKSFVSENGACQTGRGTTYSINLFKHDLRRFYINHGLNGYILQIDVKHYYPSMRHNLVKWMFHEKLDGETYSAVEAILDGQYPGEVGYKPGSQMVQIAGISFLDGLDHFIKEKLHIKDYIRVMDDLVLLHEDKDYLIDCLAEIVSQLAALGLKPHEKKTHIAPLSDGITFLGFHWRLTDTGKVLMLPKKESIKDCKRTVGKLMRMYAKGERSRKCVEDSFKSRMSFYENGTTWRLRKSLNQWFNERMAICDEQHALLPHGDAPQRPGGH